MLTKLIGHLKIDEGRVIRCFHGTIVIQLAPDCSDLSTCSACTKHGTCAQGGKSETVTITGEHLPDCSPGMRARVSHFLLNKTFAAFLVFIFPLICAVAAMLIGQNLTGQHTESVRTILSGGAGFMAGFLLTAQIDRMIKKYIPTPEIISVF